MPSFQLFSVHYTTSQMKNSREAPVQSISFSRYTEKA